MVKRIGQLVCVFSILLLAETVMAQQAECSLENTSFQVGEKLKYKVSYKWLALWVNAGEVKFSVNNASMDDTDCYHLLGEGKTYKGYDWFFKVRDRYESYMDKVLLRPVRFIRDVSEGGFEFKNDVSFDYDEGIATTSKKKVNISDCIQDVMSAIYYSRCVDFSTLKKNDIVPMDMYLDNKVYSIYIRYLGKEVVKTKLGKFNCVKFKPLLIEGTMFKGGEKMNVYVTDDENKIPIRVESPILVGSIVADLSEYSGLKNPLSSRID